MDDSKVQPSSAASSPAFSTTSHHDAGDQTPRVPAPRGLASAELEQGLEAGLRSVEDDEQQGRICQDESQVDAMLQDQEQQDSLESTPLRRPFIGRSTTAVRTPAVERSEAKEPGTTVDEADQTSTSPHADDDAVQEAQRIAQERQKSNGDDEAVIDEFSRSPVAPMEEELNEYSTPAIQPTEPTEPPPSDPIPMLDPAGLFHSETPPAEGSSSDGRGTSREYESGGAASPRRLPSMAKQRMRDLGVAAGAGREVRLMEDVERDATDEEDDFYKERSIFVNVPVGSLSISPSNRDVCLASRKGLFILDMQYPDQVPRWIPQGGFSQIADCQWSPHPATSNLILTTSSQRLLVWDVSATSASTSLYRSIDAHHRAITDINWHARDPNLMATTSIDGAVRGWDLRVAAEKHRDGVVSMGTASVRLADWGDAGTQVKWNRQHDHILASAHGNNICVWDTRKGAIPITVIEAHDARIYGIDWDRRNRHELVTCSLDHTIKYWSINELDRKNNDRWVRNPYFPSVPPPQTPTATIVTRNPVWRARNLPFGHGVLSLPQRGDSALEMWGKDQGDGPLERFEEYSAPVKEFVWRTRGGSDPSFEDREFQLITWSKDRRLRMWPVSTDVLKRAGYQRGAPIDVLVSRRNAANISYANVDREHANSPASTPGFGVQSSSNMFGDFKAERLRSMSLRTQVDGTQPNRLKHRSEATVRGATMTKGTAGGRTRRKRAIDQLDWIGGISTIRRSTRGKAFSERTPDSSSGPSRMASISRQPSKSRRSSFDRPNPLLSSSLMRSWHDRRGSLPEQDEDNEGIDLAEEIRQVKRKYPRAKFESKNLNIKRRQCSIALNGPWGEDGQLAFVRVYFRFPASYPRAQGKDGCPAFSLSNSPLISKDTRDMLRQKLHRICEDTRPCLAACVSFLLGHDERKGRMGAPLPVDSDSESDLGVVTGPMLPKVTCGACWGTDGTLVTFFAVAPPTLRGFGSTSRSPSTQGSVGGVKDEARTSFLKAYSALTAKMDPNARNKRSQYAGLVLSQGFERIHRPLSNQGKLQGGGDRFIPDLSRHRPKSTVWIKIQNTGRRELAERYRFDGGVVACSENAALAARYGNIRHLNAWRILVSILSDKADAQDAVPTLKTGRASAFRCEVHRKVLRALEDQLLIFRDVQMLAMMFAFLAENEIVKAVAAKPLATIAPQAQPADYFAPRRPTPSPSGRNPLRTPRAPSPSPASPYFGGSLSQFLPLNASSRSNLLPLRDRQGSEVSLGTPPLTSVASIAVPASLARQERSASPRARESFRSQIFSRQYESYSSEMVFPLGQQSSLRSHPTSSTLASAVSEPQNTSRRRQHHPETMPPRPSRAPSSWVLKADLRLEGSDTWLFLDPERLHFYECYKRWYADLLRRWQLDHVASRNLQTLYLPPDEVDRKRADLQSSEPVTKPRPNLGLKSKKMSCSICQLPVRGLGTSCLICAHSMHLDCLRGDPSISTTVTSSSGVLYRCPSGCGCQCIEFGGLNGFFETQRVLPIVADPPTPPSDEIVARIAAAAATVSPTSKDPTTASAAAAAATTSSSGAFALAKARIRNLAADSFATWG